MPESLCFWNLTAVSSLVSPYHFFHHFQMHRAWTTILSSKLYYWLLTIVLICASGIKVLRCGRIWVFSDRWSALLGSICYNASLSPEDLLKTNYISWSVKIHQERRDRRVHRLCYHIQMTWEIFFRCTFVWAPHSTELEEKFSDPS